MPNESTASLGVYSRLTTPAMNGSAQGASAAAATAAVEAKEDMDDFGDEFPPPPVVTNPSAPPLPVNTSSTRGKTNMVASHSDHELRNLEDFETQWLISQVRNTGQHKELLDPEPTWARDLERLAAPPPPLLADIEPVIPAPPTPIKPARREFNRVTGPMYGQETAPPEGIGCCGYILMGFSWLLIILTLPFSLCLCIKVVQEYERAVIFRLGRLLPGGAKGPGLFFIIPCMDSYTSIDLRTVSFDVPPQEVLSKDSVTVAVDAVVYYRVQNATISVTNVEDANRSTRLLAATTLRNVLGTKNLSEILSDRENISHLMQHSLDEATDPWGVKVERVEIKDVRLPVQLQRAMAAEAEAAREARAKVIAAEGEHKASRALKDAADIISQSPSALQLRYLQTLNTISAEKNSTIIFPLPIDFINSFATD